MSHRTQIVKSALRGQRRDNANLPILPSQPQADRATACHGAPLAANRQPERIAIPARGLPVCGERILKSLLAVGSASKLTQVQDVARQDKEYLRLDGKCTASFGRVTLTKVIEKDSLGPTWNPAKKTPGPNAGSVVSLFKRKLEELTHLMTISNPHSTLQSRISRLEKEIKSI